MKSMNNGPKTIRDVALFANVSPKTVSRVFNNEPHVRPELRARVRAAIAALKYVPQDIAQEFAGRPANVVGFIFLSHEKLFCKEYYYTEVFDAAHKALTEQNYFTLFMAPDRIPSDAVALVLDIVRRRKLSGVIMADLVGCDYAALEHERIPAVALNRRIAGPTTASVTLTNAIGMRETVQHLYDLGHRRIGFLGRIAERPSSMERFRGFEQALKALHLPVMANWIHDCRENTPEAAQEAVRTFLRTPAAKRETALCCFTDTLALAAMHALQKSGWNIPRDISVVGFDDVDLSRLVTPALTTIAVPRDRMGHLAVEKLLGMIDGKVAGAVTEVPTRLIVRESTAAPIDENDQAEVGR